MTPAELGLLSRVINYLVNSGEGNNAAIQLIMDLINNYNSAGGHSSSQGQNSPHGQSQSQSFVPGAGVQVVTGPERMSQTRSPQYSNPNTTYQSQSYANANASGGVNSPPRTPQQNNPPPYPPGSRLTGPSGGNSAISGRGRLNFDNSSRIPTPTINSVGPETCSGNNTEHEQGNAAVWLQCPYCFRSLNVNLNLELEQPNNSNNSSSSTSSQQELRLIVTLMPDISSNEEDLSFISNSGTDGGVGGGGSQNQNQQSSNSYRLSRHEARGDLRRFPDSNNVENEISDVLADDSVNFGRVNLNSRIESNRTTSTPVRASYADPNEDPAGNSFRNPRIFRQDRTGLSTISGGPQSQMLTPDPYDNRSHFQSQCDPAQYGARRPADILSSTQRSIRVPLQVNGDQSNPNPNAGAANRTATSLRSPSPRVADPNARQIQFQPHVDVDSSYADQSFYVLEEDTFCNRLMDYGGSDLNPRSTQNSVRIPIPMPPNNVPFNSFNPVAGAGGPAVLGQMYLPVQIQLNQTQAAPRMNNFNVPGTYRRGTI